MAERIWIVMGSTGEYSDRNEWPVAAYREERLALTHVELATARAKELEQWTDGEEPWRWVDRDKRPANEHDPDMQMDYTGTDYYAQSVDLLTSVLGVPEVST